MDIVYFLKRRTAFIKRYYDLGRSPFEQIMRKIEAEEEPYLPDACPSDPESGEPAFLNEWLEAEEAVEVHSHSCISMLSASLRVYFNELEREFFFTPTEVCKKSIFGPLGFVAGYKACLGQILETDWSDCPINFSLIEQVVLARNDLEHAGEIHSFSVYHRAKSKRRFPDLFFVSEDEDAEEGSLAALSALTPRIEIRREKLFAAIDEVDRLADWVAKRWESIP